MDSVRLLEPSTAEAESSVGRVSVHWVVKAGDRVANAFGYNTHNRYMRKHLAEFCDVEDGDSPLALHIVPANEFTALPGKVNVLFTMWEFLDVPDSYIPPLNIADFIITPCTFCTELFSQYTDKPVYTCHEGVDIDVFDYHQRLFPTNRPFRYLWVGAPNPRKGYPVMVETLKIFEKVPGIEIYLKTTVPNVDRFEVYHRYVHERKLLHSTDKKHGAFKNMAERMNSGQMEPVVKLQRIGRFLNIVLDTRVLTQAELVELYDSAHCFVLPSMGEGWGLTLIEAMATGLPCIAPKHTGMADFFDSKHGYCLPYNRSDVELSNYDMTAPCFVPSTKGCVELMTYVFSNYADALRRGRKASEYVRTLFGWRRSAMKLKAILDDIWEKAGLE